MHSDLVYIDVCSNLVFGILLPTVQLDILNFPLLLIIVADECVLVICHNLFMARLHGGRMGF